MATHKTETKGGLWDTAKIVLQALLLALVVRTFLFQPFNIPSGSMMDTLLIGDYIFVSKYSYGYSRYSFPFGLVPFEGRVLASEPKRGDIVVFKLPTDNSTDYIKRVIGLPGDRIQMKDGVLYINDVAVPKVADGFYTDHDQFGVERSIPRFRETLPNGVSYDVLDLDPNGFWDNTQVYTVPPGHYFMMGDNRDNSSDSRVLDHVGYVPFENLVGKAQVIFFSIDGDQGAWKVWKWPTDVRWGRIFTML